MQTPVALRGRYRVLLLEPNVALRSAITTILGAEQYRVDVVDSLEQLLEESAPFDTTVALVAWQGMHGLLAEERRSDLADVTRRVRLVLMVPRPWWRLLEGTDLTRAVTALIAKPFEAEELLATVQTALAAEISPDSRTA
jgi:DNA-binding response OmpR family regulator